MLRVRSGELALVGLGGALGTGLRLLVAQVPDGVLLANVTGAFLLGLLAGRSSADSPWRWLLGPGLLGAYTTFSAFAVELAHGPPVASIAHALVAVALGLLAAVTGLRLTGGRA